MVISRFGVSVFFTINRYAMLTFFYTLNLLLVASGLLTACLRSSERTFSLALMQALLGLPLLAGEYLYLNYHLEVQIVQLVLFSEIVFALLWFAMALRFRDSLATKAAGSIVSLLLKVVAGAIVAAAAGYFLAYGSAVEISADKLVFKNFSPSFFSAVFTLVTVLFLSWSLEQFWRSLDARQSWEYKILVAGCFLVCGALAWSSSYRLTFLVILPKHLLLLSALLISACILMFYPAVQYRLLNRQIVVSRKVIYTFVVPYLLATYLLGFGLVSLVMRTFGFELSFVLKWLLLVLGCIAAVLFGFSGKVRSRFQFFISTHFYLNKYEYRDEWLALSQSLQGALTEAEVVDGLREVMSRSLFTTKIFIWLGDSSREYRLASSPENNGSGNTENIISADDLLLQFIQTHSYFYLEEREPDPEWQEVWRNWDPFLTSQNLQLFAPLSVGNQLIGMIGLGPEYTGGQYGRDDFDLLSGLGSQTASALMAVRMSEELADAREQQAWNRLSAFVLHDIKNAASMLSLLQENAPEHIHEPEFQQDMLELVADALRRMGHVEQRLETLKDEVSPVLQNLGINSFIQDCMRKLGPKLISMKIVVEGGAEFKVNSDPQLLFSVMENLLINASQAQLKGKKSVVKLKISKDSDGGLAMIEVCDNGPGIADELLPGVLFEPFKTNKEGGSGVGLWQVKRLVSSLGGSISAENMPNGGARFVLKLPLVPE